MPSLNFFKIFSRANGSKSHPDKTGQFVAANRSLAIIEFSMDGTILYANENFLQTMGYRLDEIVGQHHRIFADPYYAQSAEYRAFWEKLNRGDFDAGEYKRIKNGGEEIWLQASYTPILDRRGRPTKVVKFATDITEAKRRSVDYVGQIEAIGKSQAVIEFTMDGSILNANENFLNTLGYTLDEIKGKHHSMFAEPKYTASAEYKDFWGRLNRGEYDSGEYKRLGKGGREIWIQASYNPIMDPGGKPYKVVKYATDVTAQKLQNADYVGQLEAIGKSQAVIEFTMDGNILNANENFLNTLGYTLDEIKGKHHSMFAEPKYAASAAYKDFWAKLGRGEYDSGEYKRLGKGGKEIWIQASYNPIMDLNGKPYKVVKYATDVTAQKLQNADYVGQIEAIGKSQAVIEFTMAGNILNANENFLNTLGYTLDEIKGKHHSMFAEPKYAASAAYKDFWAKLGRGEYDSGEYKRLGKGGKEIWIQASYNPIMDLNGKPYKVVKYASDITGEKEQAIMTEQCLGEAGQVMRELANGNLSKFMVGEYSGEFETLKEAINTTVTKLRETVEQISRATGSINVSASEISQGNNNLSARTEQQAANLEETAASMEELTSTVKNNADNAQQANQVAATARSAAENGGEVVSQAVTAMGQISESSNKIAEIIGVIDEIAFQTNLLALNASVEAARAGEQGRGFAVVATEVRNLASRSAEAAKEIKGLIKDSVEKVNSGSELVNQTGESLQEIVDGVKKVGDIIAEIASASSEQSAGIDQVNQAVTQMDEMTQQNAALAEQTSAASVAMTTTANEMQQAMSFFRTSASNDADELVQPMAQAAAARVAPKAAAPKPTLAPKRAPAPKAAPRPVASSSSAAAVDEEEWEEF
ncbi:MAG: PAS domain-containing protein [Chromatiales bacterium]|jgi:methyl-accepting chemotaxis protein